jgi:hypothetical protein
VEHHGGLQGLCDPPPESGMTRLPWQRSAGPIGRTTRVAVNFAKFFGYCRCLEETVGMLKTGS